MLCVLVDWSDELSLRYPPLVPARLFTLQFGCVF